MKRVAEIMETEVVTLDPRTTLLDAARTLSAEGISGAPVVDRNRRLMGVLSASDILRLKAHDAESREDLYPFDPVEALDPDAGTTPERSWFYFGSERAAADPPEAEELSDSLEERTVRELMSDRCYSVKPGDSVQELARVLLENRIHRALVLEEERLVGIVTAFDVLQVVARGEG